MATGRPRRLNRVRVGGMALLMFGVCAGLVALVRVLPPSPAGQVMTALAGVVIAVCSASLLEWLIHRYVYHRSVLPGMGRIHRIHHRGHHHAIFPTWRYVTSGAPRRHPILESSTDRLHPPGWTNLLTRLSHLAFYLAVGAGCVWLPAWWLTRSGVLLGTLVLANVVIADLIVRVHDAIHYPAKHPWLQRQAWFRFLDRHHYIHHVDTEANVNFLLPLTDWLFGTLRRTLTPAELARHGSLEEAKLCPVGESEPAREVARPREAARGAVSG
jgi:hypothetical protein